QLAIPGEDRSPALALVNTRHGHRGGPVEHLAGADETRRWLAGRDLLDRAAVVTPAGAADLRTLRGTIRELLVARARRRPREPAAVRDLNAAAAAAPGAATLHWTTRDRPTQAWTPAPGTSGIDRARALIAADAIDLVCGDRAESLYACGGPGCVRLFLRDHPR